jgi:hypothetical protein
MYQLVGWLFIVLQPAQEFFTYMFTSPLLVKGCKIYANARCSGYLSREGYLSCHICCDTGPRFFRSHPKDHPILSTLTTHKGMWRILFLPRSSRVPIQSPLTTHKGMWRIYSYPDPHGSKCIGVSCLTCDLFNYDHISTVWVKFKFCRLR